MVKDLQMFTFKQCMQKYYIHGVLPCQLSIWWDNMILLVHGSAAGRCLTSVSSTNKTDRHNITEILLKVALNTITLTHIFTITTAQIIISI